MSEDKLNYVFAFFYKKVALGEKRHCVGLFAYPTLQRFNRF